MTIATSEAEDVPALISQVITREPTKQMWFRGQGCNTHELNPSIWRRMRLKAFPDPVSSAQVLDLETRLITRFRQRSLPYWPAGYPQTDWEHLFAMQHFGLPTRLLDWTTNLLMAVYFALDHDVSRCPCGTDRCVPTIWLLDPVKLNRSNPRLHGLPIEVLATSDKHVNHWEPGVEDAVFAPDPIAIYGTYNSDRIAAQHGTFTVAGKSMTPLEEGAVAAGTIERIHLTGDVSQLWRLFVNESVRWVLAA
ncbi:FRG domain-containing protein [Arthrobacter bussei]|uniref:FRG domain-containing protein n=1 Tax=Arthrobacter bussei TaxID=2594179 RepID=A0A7X1NSI1_9MICC|nr:FRG domain-containing protein [Arthrobacter bussei]MPY12216.1 FRG domain-containing protein [Arthrobacter bussei]